MKARGRLAVGLAAAASLTGCGPRDGAAAPTERPGLSSAERAYRRPPAASAVTRLANGEVRIDGEALPGARVRMATSAGQATFAGAGADGHWRIFLPVAFQPRLYGLSMVEGARSLQSEGYLVVTPQGLAAQLRAGAGALVLISGPPRPRLLAVDYDRKGGTVVSGQAARGETVGLLVDGVSRGRLAPGADGRFSMALDEPLAPGDHQFEIAGGRGRAFEIASVTPAEPLADGPFRASATTGGWRIDWMTPGGGVQTTLLLAKREAGA